jgi:hypothetical protein
VVRNVEMAKEESAEIIAITEKIVTDLEEMIVMREEAREEEGVAEMIENQIYESPFDTIILFISKTVVLIIFLVKDDLGHPRPCFDS